MNFPKFVLAEQSFPNRAIPIIGEHIRRELAQSDFVARVPKRNAAHVEQLFRWWGEGKIAPKISASYPLERGGDAIAALRDRKAIGKLVVTLD